MNKLKKSFSFGGGETLELTCLEAADRFVTNVLSKNLKSENVRFPEHRIRLGVTPEGPVLSGKEREERGNQITEPEEKILYNTTLTELKGAECERAVWDYIISTPSDVRCATFMSYDNKMFLQYTGASNTTKIKKATAPDAQNPKEAEHSDGEKNEAQKTDKAQAPDAEKAQAPNAEKNVAPDAEKAKASGDEKNEAPDAEKAEAPGDEKNEALDAEKAQALYAEKGEAPVAKKVEALNGQAADAEKAKAPDAEKAKASDAKKAKAPDAEFPDAEKAKAPGDEKNEAPDAEKTEAPDAKKNEATAAEKAEAPEAQDAEKAEAPDAEKNEALDAEKAETPDAEKAEAPDANKSKAPDAKKAEVPDSEKAEAPGAEKIEDSDVSTTANKSTQTQDQDFKKVPKLKSNKSAKANKSTKNEDIGDNKCPEGRSDKSTQTKSARGKANKGPPITDNQEFDFVFLLGEYKTFVIFEVKASFNHGKGKWEEQLERAELFYKTIIKYIGDEDYKDWTFLPVAAFPNAPNIKEVNYFE